MYVYGIRKKEKEDESDKHVNKIAGLKASQSVVGIVSHSLPVEIWENLDGFTWMLGPPAKEAYFFSSGIILECELSDDDDDHRNYLNTVLAPACLFKNIDPHKIDIDVYVFTGDSYKAKLLACDFHYNLSLLTFTSQYPFTAASALLTPIDDVLSIDPYHQPHLLNNNSSFGLRPCSNLFKVAPDTQLVSLTRSHHQLPHVYRECVTLCLRDPVLRNRPLRDPEGSQHAPTRISCNELYEIKNTQMLGLDGAPILNSFGKIIGILFYTNFFLPSNIILRWWNHYKSSGGFRRPIIGMKIANFHESDVNTLAQFTASFPNISTAVIVTKVKGNSPAYRSGIRTNDVIVKLDGELVRSKMEFYELVWEKAGKVVKVDILRDSDGKELNLSFVIEEASPNRFHQWPHPRWSRVW